MCAQRSPKRALIDKRKLKLSILLGLLLGVGLTISMPTRQKSATGKELQQQAVQGLSMMAALLPADLAGGDERAEEPAGLNGLVPENPDGAAEEPVFEPTDFLDASMELLLATEPDPTGAPVVTLESGEQLQFTILPELQESVEKLYQNYLPEEAAFVAIDPRTGAVLAMTGFNDGEVTPHRALVAEGPAASIFKIISGSALVEKHRIRPGRQFCYHGGRQGISKRLLTPDPKRDNACLTFAQALGKSANVVFARLADKEMSRADMKRYGERFGFNRVLPFAWPVQLSKMDVPDDRLEFARMAAGFHHSKLSPMHGALIASAIANKGVMMQPQILQSVIDPDGREVFHSTPAPLLQSVSPETARAVTRMMVTTTTEGTARKYFSRTAHVMDGVVVAGKTGSLSHVKDGQRYYHSWLVGFAPADNPRIAFASLVVNGPKWRVKGPYIAKKALEKYFQLTGTEHQVAKAR